MILDPMRKRGIREVQGMKASNRIALLLSMLALLGLLPAVLHADPSDPFDPANKAPVLSIKTQSLLPLIDFELKVVPAKAKRGEVVRVTLSGKTKKGFHTYPITQRTNQQDPSDITVKYSGVEGIKPLWPIEESPPELAVSTDGKVVLEHGEPFTWTQDLLIDPQAKPGQYELTVTIENVQVCNERTCSPPAPYRPLYAPLEILDGDAVAPPRAVADRPQDAPAVKVITPTQKEIADLRAKMPGPGPINDLPGRTGDATNLWSFLWFASLSAFLMLLTPCVFPMIPITVNFFIKQSEKEHHNPLMMASVYAGTIIVLLTTIMLALGSVVIDLANNTYFNLGLGVVLIFFALSLFGMYEIELPRFLARFTSSREGKGGLIGTVFMAMTFTITSFTCTGPFLGLMLSSVAGVKPPMFNLALGAIVYSATFAAPFFVLALFPSMLKKIPKSGSWLNSVKVTMGFLELGAALKFLSNADFAFFPGDPQVFNYDTVLAAWIALSISCSLYLLGLFRLPHDDRAESIGVIRMLIAVAFLGLAVYLAPAMFGLHPAGVVGDNVVAFLPIRTGHDGDAPGIGGRPGTPESDHRDWYMDYEDAWKDAVENNKAIFIDFTGTNCSNCRYNEQNIFPLPPVKQELSRLVKLSLYTDTVPNRKLSAKESKEQGNRNQNWQSVLVGKDLALPTYVVFQPARDSAFENGVPKGRIVGKTEGAIRDVPAFVRVLQSAQTKLTAQLKQ
jgi:thiol:disulfide interchange protein